MKPGQVYCFLCFYNALGNFMTFQSLQSGLGAMGWPGSASWYQGNLLNPLESSRRQGKLVDPEFKIVSALATKTLHLSRIRFGPTIHYSAVDPPVAQEPYNPLPAGRGGGLQYSRPQTPPLLGIPAAGSQILDYIRPPTFVTILGPHLGLPLYPDLY